MNEEKQVPETKRCFTKKDGRIVYGINCTWFGHIHNVKLSGNLPVCPYCASPLMEVESENVWWAQVQQFNQEHSGYGNMLHWQKDNKLHFGLFSELRDAYKKASGIDVCIDEGGN